MNRLGYKAAQTLILLLAFAWPLGAFVYIPWVGVNLTSCVAVAVVTLWIVDFLVTRRQRAPFELVWPVTVLVVLLWIRAERDHTLLQTLGLLTFLAVAHVTGGSLFARRLLRLTAAGGGIIAAMALAAEAAAISRSLMPLTTTESPNLPAWVGWSLAPVVASPRDLLDTVLTLAVCLCAAPASWRRDAGGQLVTRTIGGRLFFVAVVIVAPWLVTHVFTAGLPELSALHPLRFVTIVVTVWLFARVTAKAVVDGREHGEGTFAVAVLAGVACLAHVSAPATAFPIFLIPLGFVAGGALPTVRDEAKTLPSTVIAIPAIVLLAVSLFHVYPANGQDPRNYETRLRADVTDGRPDRAWQHLALVLYWNPYEQRGRLWRARLALEFNRPYLAAHEFNEAVDPLYKTRQVLPAPAEAEIHAFLVRMRDYCSSLPQPERVFAYEKALVATGRVNDALALLRDKSDRTPKIEEEPDARMCLAAFLQLLDFPRDREGELVAAVPEARMPGLLAAAGAEIWDPSKSGLDPESDLNPIVVEFGVMEVSYSGSSVGELTFETPHFPDYNVPPVSARWQIDRSDPAKVKITLIASQTADTAGATIETIMEGPGYSVDLVVDFDQPLPDAPAILILRP